MLSKCLGQISPANIRIRFSVSKEGIFRMRSTKLRILAACLFTGIALLLGGSLVDAAKPAPSTPLPFRYRVVYLGTLPGATTSLAMDINNWGDVVGKSNFAFVYRGVTGDMLDLNSLVDPALGVRLLQGDAINDNGQIGGSGNHGVADSQFIFRLTPPETPDADWVLERAALPGGGEVRGINADGDMIFIGDSQCFAWPAGADPVTLGTLDGRAYEVGRGVTDRDATGVIRFVTGGTSTQPSGQFAYQIGADASTLHEGSIGSFGALYSGPTAISPDGDIVGAGIISQKRTTVWHAFLKLAGATSLTDLGTLGGVDSEATAINSVGDIIGMAETAQSATRFIRTGGKMYDLEKMVDRDSNGNLPNELRGIAQINAGKVICGPSAWGGNPSVQAFVLVPYTP